MAKKREPITLLTTDDARVDLVAVKRVFAFQRIEVGGDDEYADDTPALTASEWCNHHGNDHRSSWEVDRMVLRRRQRLPR